MPASGLHICTQVHPQACKHTHTCQYERERGRNQHYGILYIDPLTLFRSLFLYVKDLIPREKVVVLSKHLRADTRWNLGTAVLFAF